MIGWYDEIRWFKLQRYKTDKGSSSFLNIYKKNYECFKIKGTGTSCKVKFCKKNFQTGFVVAGFFFPIGTIN